MNRPASYRASIHPQAGQTYETLPNPTAGPGGGGGGGANPIGPGGMLGDAPRVVGAADPTAAGWRHPHLIAR